MSSKLKIDTRVRSLKAYMEDFELGKIQIPSFQRDFLWSHDAIKQLFDSIKNNFPIGSIQFWKPINNVNSWINEQDSFIGPYRVKDTNMNDAEIVYILDGVQRLSSLFGCLTNPEKYNTENLELDKKTWNDKFNLYYDLDEEKFTYLRQRVKNQPYQVPVYIFMKSVDFRQYSRKYFDEINDEQKIELYLDRADALGQIFTNYQIALVDINYASIEEAVEIFWRVNAKGLEISKDWIVSALTLKDDFRLGTEIDSLLSELRPYDFHKIKRDIIFQCIQNSFGRVYFDYEIEELVRRNDFVEVTKKAIESIKRAVKFLYENLLVLNSKLLPYNSQLIFITSFFNHLGDKEPNENQILALKRWFWISSYSNYFTIYSLSNQRKAFEKFVAFIFDENIDPIYNDKGSSVKFVAQEFPKKIYMGSVRSKALALFMINYAMGIKTISLTRFSVDSIEEFDIGNLFSIPQKDNPAENFVPIIIERDVNPNGDVSLISIAKSKRPKNYSYILDKENENLFVTKEISNHFKKNSESIFEILEKRKDYIIKQEFEFQRYRFYKKHQTRYNEFTFRT